MKKLCALLLLIAFLFCTPNVVYASDVTDAEYAGAVVVSSNSSTTLTNVSVAFSGLPTSALITGGFIDADANYMAAIGSTGADIAYMPGYAANATILFLPSINAHASLTNTLYTAHTWMAQPPSIFLADAGMTTADSATLELGSSYELDWSGFFDTTAGSGKYICNKQNAIRVYVSPTVSENITIGIGTAYRRFYQIGSGSMWPVIAPTPILDASTATFGSNSCTVSDGYYTKTIVFETKPFTASAIKTYWYATGSGGGNIGTISIQDATGWHSIFASGVPGSAAWQSNNTGTSLPITAIAYNYYQGGTGTGTIYIGDVQYTSGGIDYDLGALVDYTFATMLSATGVATGAHTMAIYSDPTTVRLVIDSVEVASTTSAAVPDNANAWYFCQNGVMPYLTDQEIYVLGHFYQQINWNYGTTLLDLAGEGHDATPTYRTTSSSADVSATLASFRAVTEAKAPTYTISNPSPFITTTPGTTGLWSSNITVSHNNTFVKVIDETAQESGVPPVLPIALIGTFLMVSMSLTVSGIMAKGGARSPLVKMGILACLLGIGVALAPDVFGFWSIPLFLIIALAILLEARNRG